MKKNAAVNNVVNFSQYLGYAAALRLDYGHVEEARAAIGEAFHLMRRIDERYYCAELHRIEGEVLRAEGHAGEAREAAFAKALQLAREQGAKLLELRATLGLARLWQEQGRTAEARERIGEVLRSFEGSPETADTREARELLDALGDPPG